MIVKVSMTKKEWLEFLSDYDDDTLIQDLQFGDLSDFLTSMQTDYQRRNFKIIWTIQQAKEIN